MSGAAETVLLVNPNVYAMRAAKEQLSTAGFDVVEVGRPRALADAAAGRSVAAILTPYPPRHRRRATLRQIPVVVLAGAKQRRNVPWPVGALLRGVPTFDPRDLGRDGALAEALRSAIRAPALRPATRRERAGEALWQFGSILFWLGITAAVLFIVLSVLQGRTASSTLLDPTFWLLFVAGGEVSIDLGSRMGLGERAALSAGSWFWVVMLVVGVALRIW